MKTNNKRNNSKGGNNMKDKEIMDVVFLLDRSGSMHGMENDTIGGYNSYLKSMRQKNAKITTILFDNEYEMITKRENISNVRNMDYKTYYTRGCTALLDAIGKTISYMDSENPSKVVFIITTDGLENASIEYNKGQIKEMIEGHKNWEFIYLGANIDSYKEASSIGISKSRTSNFAKTKKGMGAMFGSVQKLCATYESEGCINEDWKDGLEDYIGKEKEL